MIDGRTLLTGIVVGALIALLVSELSQFGLAFAEWSVRGTRAGEALVSGALIGAASQAFGHTRARR